MAFEQNNIKIIHILLENKTINPNIKFNINNKECTPLSYAIDKDNVALIKSLLSLNIDPNIKLTKILHKQTEEITALSIAIAKENIEAIKLLLACPTIDLNITLAIKDRKTKTIIEENTYLHLAVDKGNKEIINLFLNEKTIIQTIY